MSLAWVCPALNSFLWQECPRAAWEQNSSDVPSWRLQRFRLCLKQSASVSLLCFLMFVWKHGKPPLQIIWHHLHMMPTWMWSVWSKLCVMDPTWEQSRHTHTHVSNIRCTSPCVWTVWEIWSEIACCCQALGLRWSCVVTEQHRLCSFSPLLLV